jgi:hypothetical protein
VVLAGAFVVTVTVENTGDVGAEVAVSIAAPAGERGTRIFVPAHGREVARIEFPATPTSAAVNDGSVPESDMKNNQLQVEAPPARVK